MNAIDLQEYGKLEQTVAQLKEDVGSMKTDIATIKTLVEQANGGWRTMMWIGGAVAAVTATLTWISQHITFIR